MIFEHIYERGLAQGSYFIGCQEAGVAAVIDPKRDVDTYTRIADSNKMIITHVIETHIHADFLSGSRELGKLTGANLYLSGEGGDEWQYQFSHKTLVGGDQLLVGNILLEVLHTPGHTPESISLLLTDTKTSKEPMMIFTGDFVFVGDVGRPDLLDSPDGQGDKAKQGAALLFQSLSKFRKLPDHLQLWPGHGAGSACGKSLGAVPSSTVGFEKLTNPALQFENNEAAFTEFLLAEQPEAPVYFSTMKQLNRKERPLLTEVPALRLLSGAALQDAMANGLRLVDCRDREEYEQGFIPGSYHIANNDRFSTWSGWLLSYDEPFMLLVEPGALETVTRKLMRIGLDNVHGYVPSPEAYTGTGGTLEQVRLLSFAVAKDWINMEDVQVVDIRSKSEYEEGHIPAAINLFVGTLPANLDKIERHKKVIIHCQSGDRAAIGYSILASNGFTNVWNFAGGMDEWEQQQEPVIKSDT